jgi:RNA polymerase sigma-70 factor (ECF subfamily)
MAEQDDHQAAVKVELIALIPRLRRFCHALTGRRADADDVAQLALERALARLDSFREGTRLDSWLFQIARNAWIDEIRAQKRRGSPVELEEAGGLVAEDGRTVTAARLDLARVRQLIDALPEEQRAVIAFVAIEGFSYQEAATALDIPIGTVMSRLARARKAIADRLEKQGDERP